MRMEETKTRFSQRHPFMFGVMMILLAVILFGGITAFIRFMGWNTTQFTFGGDKLGVVKVEGAIFDSTKVVDWIRELRRDDSIKGVLLRINSPGGAIAPSQEIYSAVAALAAVKPVVASYSTVAASGGYYASVPSQVIFANPGSITGSIGVMAEFVTVTEALSKLGIKPEVLTTGKYKAAGTPMRDLSDEQRAQLLAMMQDMHQQFVQDVATARSMTYDQVAALATGAAYTGRQAQTYGLVDELGTRDDAFDKLKELCGIDGTAVLVEGPPEEKTLIQEIMGSVRIDLTSSTALDGWTFSYK